jgi:hypothetical protein
MRSFIVGYVLLLATSAAAAPTSAPELATPPADAERVSIVSIVSIDGKHGESARGVGGI